MEWVEDVEWGWDEGWVGEEEGDVGDIGLGER